MPSPSRAVQPRASASCRRTSENRSPCLSATPCHGVSHASSVSIRCTPIFSDEFYESIKGRNDLPPVYRFPEPAARVLEKLGFVHEGTLREDCVVDGVVSDSWVFGLLRRDRTPAGAADR